MTTAEIGERLLRVGQLEAELQQRYRDKLIVNPRLDRRMVSFQANKLEKGHRWCKYKEGFSADLIHYLLDEVRPTGRLLDPFAGSGTTMFVAAERGFDALGIELLPSSAEIIELRRDVDNADPEGMASRLRQFAAAKSWQRDGRRWPLEVLPITRGAYPAETDQALRRYLFEAHRVNDPAVSRVLRFAALCVLESISFTRKDGQYLRWDHRAERGQGGKKFDKGPILGFTEAITQKLCQIADDLAPKERPLAYGDGKGERGSIELLRGSCLDIMPTLDAGSFGGLITSPPYCNRYDYTRTYALELAMLGVDQQAIKRLRQAMVSCTVENRFKQGIEDNFSRRQYLATARALERQELLRAIIKYLEDCLAAGQLNNTGIPRMVQNYFREMALVISESARVLRPGAPLVMVNDNVRYQGAHVPVDLILSDIATAIGFELEVIWVLPKGKGNSSQQMGKHGRAELRKCVYVWRRSPSVESP